MCVCVCVEGGGGGGKGWNNSGRLEIIKNMHTHSKHLMYIFCDPNTYIVTTKYMLMAIQPISVWYVYCIIRKSLVYMYQ